MKLTREECEKIKDAMCNNCMYRCFGKCKSAKNLEQLINEHFELELEYEKLKRENF